MGNLTHIYLATDEIDSISSYLDSMWAKSIKVFQIETEKDVADIPIQDVQILIIDIDRVTIKFYEFIQNLCNSDSIVIVLVNSDDKIDVLQQLTGKRNLIIFFKPIQPVNIKYILSNYSLVKKFHKHSHSQINNFDLDNIAALNEKALYSDFFKVLMDNTPDAIYFKNTKNQFIMVNNSMLSVLGEKNMKSIIGKTDFDFFTADKARETMADEKKILDTGKPLINKVEKDIRNDGWTRWVSTTKLPIINKNGDISGLFGISRDITTQLNYYELLLFNEKKYRTLFNKSDIGIFILDKYLEITDLNQTGSAILDKVRIHLIKKSFFSVLNASPSEIEQVSHILATEGETLNRLIQYTGSEGPKYLSYTITQLQDSNDPGMHYIGFIRDVTSFYENERLLSEKNKKLEETYSTLVQTQSSLIHQEKLASIGQLAAGIAHEINNPLAFVSSNFNTLENYTKDMISHIKSLETLVLKLLSGNIMPEKKEITPENVHNTEIEFIISDFQDLIDESKEGFTRIRDIVQSLRDFSRVDANDKHELFDLNKSIKDTLIVARNEIKYNAIVDLDLKPITEIKCHASDINQVLLNIIVNAAQAIKEQTRDDMGTIKISTDEDENFINCYIKDDGPGIPAPIQSRIYEPFFTTKEVGKGTGIGLSISYDIVVNKHKGELSVTSQEGKGTTFCIKLPKNPVDSLPEEDQ